MRDFNDSDRRKKDGRINLPGNPGLLTTEALQSLEQAISQGSENHQLSCPAAWQIAADQGVSRLDVGVMMDQLGIRVTGCQLGFFATEKTGSSPVEKPDEIVLAHLDGLAKKGQLTCTSACALAQDLKISPRAIAQAATWAGCKIRECQLGCF